MSGGRSSCCAACAGHGRASPASSPAALALRDPHALKLEAMTMGGLLPTMVFPADVAAYKKKLDPSFRATNADVESHCPNLPTKQAIAWGDFYTDWRAFVDGGTKLLSSWEAQLEEAKRYENELANWQGLISESCELSSPKIEPPGKPFPTGAVLLLGGAAVVVAALGYSFYRTGKQAGARAQQGRRYLEGEIDRRLAGGASSSSKSKALAVRR